MIRTYFVTLSNGEVEEVRGEYLEASTYSGCLAFVDHYGKSPITYGPTAWHTYREAEKE